MTGPGDGAWPPPAYQIQDYLDRSLDHYAGAKYAIILDWLRRRPGGVVLNVGCGSGELNVMLARRGYQVDAFDPAPEAVALAERRRVEAQVANVSITRGDLFHFSSARRYDAIVCIDVLEHLADEGGAVERLAMLLMPEGLLLLSVPALQWLYGYHDEELGHVRRYSRRRLLRVLDGPFVVERARYFGFLLIPVAALYSKLWRKHYPVRRSGGLLSRVILAVEKALVFPAGTSLLVMARKKS